MSVEEWSREQLIKAYGVVAERCSALEEKIVELNTRYNLLKTEMELEKQATPKQESVNPFSRDWTRTSHECFLCARYRERAQDSYLENLPLRMKIEKLERELAELKARR